MRNIVRIGTRGSQLALWQANWVKSALQREFPELDIEPVVIRTKGDKILDVPLAKVGGKGLFVKEIEEALLDARVDLAVHSMKDMPAELPEGLHIGPVPARENPGDVMISKSGRWFSELPTGARIGTSSLRRAAQLRYARPDIEILPLRGNLDTRLKKLQDPQQGLDAIVLAAAGVKRLRLEHRVTEYLTDEIMLPAVGQGALCIEARADDPWLAPKLAVLDHADTRSAVLGERAFLHRLGGSCQVPIAAHGRIRDGRFELDGLVADVDGATVIRDRLAGSPAEAESVGVELAEMLIARGAGRILEKLQAAE
jgi:hydroxymethylbilane synthase